MGKVIDNTKYMVIDVTTVEGTRLLKIGNMRACQLWGKLYQSEGKQVIAPPLEGRGFSKLETLSLQYLFWNSFQETPPEDYSSLLSTVRERFEKMPIDDTDIRDLEKEVEKRCPAAIIPKVPGEPKPKKAKQPKDPLERPKGTSTTGLVWDIADQVYKELGTDDLKVLREKIMEACENEGINKATAATQYSKWKASKFQKQKLDA